MYGFKGKFYKVTVENQVFVDGRGTLTWKLKDGCTAKFTGFIIRDKIVKSDKIPDKTLGENEDDLWAVLELMSIEN